MYGMALYTDEPLDKDLTLHLDFKILSKDDWRDISLRGKVVYVGNTDEGYKCGISFF